MKLRALLLSMASATALMLATVPASAATLGVVTIEGGSALIPGDVANSGLTQTIQWSCPNASAASGPISVTVNGSPVSVTSSFGCGTLPGAGGQAMLVLPDTFPNSSEVTVTVEQNGVEVATGAVPTSPANISFQPSPSQGKTGDTIRISGSGISNHDGASGVKINGVSATVDSWYAGLLDSDTITIQVPQCVPLDAGTITVINANGASSSEPFTVTGGTCNGVAEGSGGSGSNTSGGTSTTTTHTTTATTGTGGSGGSGTSSTTTTTSSTPSTGYAIAGPANLSVGGQGAYSLLPPPSKGKILWLTSNPSTATVSSSGVVTARQPGTVTISATSGGKSASKTIRVTPSTSSANGKGHGSGNGGTTPPPAHRGGLPGWAWILLLILLLVLLLVLLRRRLQRLRERLGKRVREGLSGARDESQTGTAQVSEPTSDAK